MNALFVAITTAVWLGILTSISPCPLASNIAAISYIGRRVEKTALVLLAGLLYTLGRAVAYTVVALLVTRSMQLIPGVSMFLQKYMSMAVGPLLVITGVVLLGIFNLRFGGGGIGSRLQSVVDKSGIYGAALLGVVFALAFCPVSAGIFFGALIPLAATHNTLLMALLFALGTALPVIGFSLLIAYAANLIGTVFKKLTAVERWVRKGTAIVMIGAGIYSIIRQTL